MLGNNCQHSDTSNCSVYCNLSQSATPILKKVLIGRCKKGQSAFAAGKTSFIKSIINKAELGERDSANKIKILSDIQIVKAFDVPENFQNSIPPTGELDAVLQNLFHKNSEGPSEISIHNSASLLGCTSQQVVETSQVNTLDIAEVVNSLLIGANNNSVDESVEWLNQWDLEQGGGMHHTPSVDTSAVECLTGVRAVKEIVDELNLELERENRLSTTQIDHNISLPELCCSEILTGIQHLPARMQTGVPNLHFPPIPELEHIDKMSFEDCSIPDDGLDQFFENIPFELFENPNEDELFESFVYPKIIDASCLNDGLTQMFEAVASMTQKVSNNLQGHLLR